MNADYSDQEVSRSGHAKKEGFNKCTLAAVIVSTLMTACATSRIPPEGSADVREKLTALQSDPQLSSRAAVAIKEAEVAVIQAEQPQKSVVVGEHLVYLADHKVDIASARAQTLLLEDQRKSLSEQREQARLDARTREVVSARQDAASARTDADQSRMDADTARMGATDARVAAETARLDAEQARLDTDLAQRDAETARQGRDAADAQGLELQGQIDALNAKATERGLVVTLGDLLFATSKSELKTSASGHLDKLAAFLNKYGDRRVVIEGHTDSVGSESSNLFLSQRRAETVRNHLLAKGIAKERIETSGKGELLPLTENDTPSGRQQNRRVEVIISHEPISKL